jgi:hypothetical protein
VAITIEGTSLGSSERSVNPFLPATSSFRTMSLAFLSQDPYVRRVAHRRDPLGTVSGLFAPDVIGVDDAYFLYYAVGMSRSGFGVATTTSPTGPFE